LKQCMLRTRKKINPMIQIRPYRPELDEPLLLELWNLAFPAEWPMTPAWFRSVALDSWCLQDHLLAEIDGDAVGFALVQAPHEGSPGGSLLALAVHPEYRRRGAGRRLHEAALERLQAHGIRQAQPGSGGRGYFWPGIPSNLPGAWAFFQALGWAETERSYDLARSLHDYQTPAWVWERARRFEYLTADQDGLAEAVVAFVAAELPDWETFFAQAAQEGRARDILLARQPGSSEILGACLVESPVPEWEPLFQQPAGEMGCFLAAQAARGHGVGMALAARATEILQARGCLTSYIRWTGLVDWYGKLGYTTWQEYIMSEKQLNSTQPQS
jgi:ribosomal protein S18 acetylase RimI-like enzyme